ncbi:hypothetical protein PMIN06_008097 [Paraphaeosphaeria minitans]
MKAKLSQVLSPAIVDLWTVLTQIYFLSPLTLHHVVLCTSHGPSPNVPLLQPIAATRHGVVPCRVEDFGPIITVLVGQGEAQHKYEIHKGLLAHYSAYFRNALKDLWAEDEDKTVKLPGEYQVGFQIFYNWLYTRSIYTSREEGRIPLTFEAIVASYIFGDAHQSPEFCNAAINVLMQKGDQDDNFPIGLLTSTKTPFPEAC